MVTALQDLITQTATQIRFTLEKHGRELKRKRVSFSVEPSKINIRSELFEQYAFKPKTTACTIWLHSVHSAQKCLTGYEMHDKAYVLMIIVLFRYFTRDNKRRCHYLSV